MSIFGTFLNKIHWEIIDIGKNNNVIIMLELYNNNKNGHQNSWVLCIYETIFFFLLFITFLAVVSPLNFWNSKFYVFILFYFITVALGWSGRGGMKEKKVEVRVWAYMKEEWWKEIMKWQWMSAETDSVTLENIFIYLFLPVVICCFV